MNGIGIMRGVREYNLSLPRSVAASHFFRAIFNAKSFTPEIFVVMAICLVQGDFLNQKPALAGLLGKDHILKENNGFVYLGDVVKNMDSYMWPDA